MLLAGERATAVTHVPAVAAPGKLYAAPIRHAPAVVDGGAAGGPDNDAVVTLGMGLSPRASIRCIRMLEGVEIVFSAARNFHNTPTARTTDGLIKSSQYD